MRITKRRVIKSKKRGGGFTANQLYQLFSAEYSGDRDDIAKEAINVYALNKTDILLHNKFFRVYFDPEEVRFIIVHMGTQMDSLRDWGNNVRNVIFAKNKFLKTERAKTAENGHKRLKEYLIQIFNEIIFKKFNEDNNDNDDNNDSKKFQTIIFKKISELKKPKNSLIKEISTEEAVDELLKTSLSTIGHSQGAVYCYLYGSQGKETIVFNPAPFLGKKPDNLYIIRIKGDIVSSLTTSGNSFFSLSPSKIVELEKKKLSESDKGFITPHFIGQLDNDYTIIGNKQLFSNDIELRPYNNKNVKENNTSVNNQNVLGGSKFTKREKMMKRTTKRTTKRSTKRLKSRLLI